MLYDDGFVAYLNGTEVCRTALSGTPAWNSRAAGSRNAETTPISFDVSGYRSELRSGDNLLAIHGLNASIYSDDFLIWAELAASKTGRPYTAVEYKRPIPLTHSVHVKARAMSTNTWSALNEAVYTVGPVAQGLRISELMYHPADPNREFIELTNVGDQTINLALVRFTQGIDFTFPAVDLAPDQTLLVVADIDTFESAYGKGLPITGHYSGNLSNAGERIQLCDALGRIIMNFTYADTWFDITDGKGYSLTVVDVKADPSGLSSADRWRPSAHPGGSPGRGGF